MNKVLVIDGAMVSRSPHVAMYLHLLEDIGVPYDVAVWNRKGDDISSLPSNFIIYNHKTEDAYPAWRKFYEIFKFYRFVKDKIRNTQYNSIVIFEIANSLFFYKYLKKHYYKRYIFDIRDYSPFCRVRLANVFLKKLIENSFATMISSKGFEDWLPKGENYIVSHNIDDSIFYKYRNNSYNPVDSKLRLLTIGNLRDPYINCGICGALGNVDTVALKFVGDGAAQPIIIEYCKEKGINNVSFYGHYQKSEEFGFYENADLINCCMENNMLSNFLMSNRIYLACLFRKPILCTRGSYQSRVIEQFGLGLVVDDFKSLRNALNDYLDGFAPDEYENCCCRFLDMVEKEQHVFKKTLSNMINDYVE